MFSLGIQEIIVIAILILILIDYKKIPEFTKGVAKVYREIKNAQENIKSELLSANIEGQKDNSIEEGSKENDKGVEDGTGRAG